MAIDKNCVIKVKHKNIVVGEGQRSVCIVNDEEKTYNVIKVDGCVIRNETSADFAISRENRVLVVELKGKGVERAVDQVTATARLLQGEEDYCQISGLIVSKSCPGVTSTLQVKKLKFNKAFGPLHVVTGRRNLYFDGLFKNVGFAKKRC